MDSYKGPIKNVKNYECRRINAKIQDPEIVEMVWFLDPEIVEKVGKSFMINYIDSWAEILLKSTWDHNE